ncbi:hypothetical protein QW180_30755 [Vibrio sinaloensis]|nr:hypothetical protein [Vibrio sinaloensis]
MKDTGGQSQRALKAREKVESLTNELDVLPEVLSFKYDDAAFSDYAKGKLSHDDIIEIAGYLLINRPIFFQKKLLATGIPMYSLMKHKILSR